MFIREQGVHWSSPQHFLARTEKFPVYPIVWSVLYYTRSPGGIYQNSSSQPHIQQFPWFIKLDQILKKTLKILIGMVSIWKQLWSKFYDFYSIGGCAKVQRFLGFRSKCMKITIFPYWSHPRGGQFIFIIHWVIKISVY